MIVRQPIKCRTCGEPRIARIQIGHQDRQEHDFTCLKCNEPIKIGLDLDQANASFNVLFIENCEPNPIEEGSLIYLSPDFPADRNRAGDALYFPSIHLAQTLTEREPFAMAEHAAQGGSLFRVTDEWSIVQKSWRLESSGKYELSGKLISDYAKRHQLDDASFRGMLWDFLNGTFQLNDNLFHEIRKIAKANIAEIRKFLLYYNQSLKAPHRRGYLNIFSDYFSNFSEHAQLFRYARQEVELQEDLHVTSVNFERSKSFYATSFEFFAGAITILTALNNIKSGRSFDRLQSIDLNNYTKTDKAKRRASISANSIFKDATAEFDSQIRNAAFHNHFFLRRDGHTIEYRTGGTGAIQTMSYTDYLLKCGRMTRQLANLLCAELLLEEIACSTALVVKEPAT